MPTAREIVTQSQLCPSFRCNERFDPVVVNEHLEDEEYWIDVVYDIHDFHIVVRYEYSRPRFRYSASDEVPSWKRMVRTYENIAPYVVIGRCAPNSTQIYEVFDRILNRLRDTADPPFVIPEPPPAVNMDYELDQRGYRTGRLIPRPNPVLHPQFDEVRSAEERLRTEQAEALRRILGGLMEAPQEEIEEEYVTTRQRAREQARAIRVEREEQERRRKEEERLSKLSLQDDDPEDEQPPQRIYHFGED